MDAMADYYEGLKERLSEGLDGREIKWLAARVPWHYNQVQAWIGGRVKPPAEFLAAYIRETGVSARWLLLDEGEMKHRDPGEADRILAQFVELLRHGSGGGP
jgi:hypothetical protein